MKVTMVSLLLLVFAQPLWLTDFETAKATAATDKKYILLNFSGSDWCAPCIKMKKEVFESESFLAIAEKELVLVRADFPRTKKNQLSKAQSEHNEGLAERFNPEGKFPFTLLLDSDGKVIRQWDGYVFASQDVYIADLKKVLSSF